MKQKKPKKDKLTKKRTTSAPKRGEYRCGKCGFFPKKAKHNCAIEKAKRDKEEAEQAANKSATVKAQPQEMTLSLLNSSDWCVQFASLY